jgi:hypothetical protein
MSWRGSSEMHWTAGRRRWVFARALWATLARLQRVRHPACYQRDAVCCYKNRRHGRKKPEAGRRSTPATHHPHSPQLDTHYPFFHNGTLCCRRRRAPCPTGKARGPAHRRPDAGEDGAAGHLTGRLSARHPALLRLRQAPGMDAVAHGRRFP